MISAETAAPGALTIAGKTFGSRLMIGTSRYPNQQIMLDAIEASGAEIVTVAVRRVSLDGGGEGVFDLLGGRYHLLPNTAGCHTARDAVLTARLAREALGTDWVKLEVIGDEDTLFPDVEHLLGAAAELVADGFVVLPYCNDDPVTCRKLEDLGCAAVMPLGAPIGSGMGLRNPYNLRIIRERSAIPVIVDAGVGTASDAALALELGCDGILLNTAVAGARDPVKMARAMRLGIEAGRLAFEAGRIPRRLYAKRLDPGGGDGGDVRLPQPAVACDHRPQRCAPLCLVDVVAAAFDGGCRWVMVREKDLSTERSRPNGRRHRGARSLRWRDRDGQRRRGRGARGRRPRDPLAARPVGARGAVDARGRRADRRVRAFDRGGRSGSEERRGLRHPEPGL